MEHVEKDSPAPSQTSDSSEESDWLDIEPDVENINFVSLFDGRSFPSWQEMLEHCKQSHNFDLLDNINRLQLDFLGAIKLINFIRARVRDRSALPKPISYVDIDVDHFLLPVIENDAVIFSLDEILGSLNKDEEVATNDVQVPVDELVGRNKILEAELESIRENFASYRLAVEQTLDRRWDINNVPKLSNTKLKDTSSYYFESYAAHEIHETMLKDFVRTDAYRNFIYQNKHLFQDKIVLDIGCGTGILSMFCAKAGAAQVIAVDRSDIIDKARENVFNNGLSGQITCVKGSIEEVVLPVDQVDIIVSEWMGYCLLYEAMLPSVLYARDRYLKRDGLLIPSSATLWIAPFKDEDYMLDHVSFWHDVYGFDMKAMQEGICDEVHIHAMPESSICGEPFPFKVLNLYTCHYRDLTFTANWSTTLSEEIKSFDGFLIWFDNFFSPSRLESTPPASTTPVGFKTTSPGHMAFTTGPYGPETHWKQGLLLTNPQNAGGVLQHSHRLAGQVSYSTHSDNPRALLLQVTWPTIDGYRNQSWNLR